MGAFKTDFDSSLEFIRFFKNCSCMSCDENMGVNFVHPTVLGVSCNEKSFTCPSWKRSKYNK